MKRFLVAFLALVGFLLVWGMAEPYFINEQRHDVQLPNLPASLEGEQIAAIADFQVGMWLANTWTVQRIVARLVEEKPAAVLIAGDFVYHADSSSPGHHRSGFFGRTFGRRGHPHLRRPRQPRLRHADQQGSQRHGAGRRGAKRVGRRGHYGPSKRGRAPPHSNNWVSGEWVTAPLHRQVWARTSPPKDRPEAALTGVPDDAPRIALMHHPESFKAFSCRHRAAGRRGTHARRAVSLALYALLDLDVLRQRRRSSRGRLCSKLW